MKGSRAEKRFSFVFVLCFLSASASGSFPKALNVTWVSYNFKTLLTWSPKPNNYSYTVEYSKFGQDNERTAHCIQMSETECDLTAALTELESKYSADVLSEPLRGMSSDLIEFPRTASDLFCPYQDTIIGHPTFKIEVSKDQRKTTIYIEDIPTALINAQKQPLTIQDIFKDDLQYRVIYNRARSSGKKQKTSANNQIELTDLDRGESYCFTVQVYISTRSINKQYGELSQVQCSPANPSFFNDYSYGVIAGGILAIIVIISIVIAIVVICCKRQQEAKDRGKEGVPLNGV